MVIRYRDKFRLIAGPPRYQEFLGLLLFAGGILTFMLSITLLREDQHSHLSAGFLGAIMIILGGWLAFFGDKLLIDTVAGTLTVTRFPFQRREWSLDEIKQIDISPASTVMHPELQTWTCAFEFHSRDVRRIPCGTTPSALSFLSAVSFTYPLPIHFVYPDFLLSCAEDLLKRRPGAIESRWVVAILCLQQCRYKRVKLELENAISLAPDEAVLHFYYAEALAASLQFEAAIKHYDTCLAARPEHVSAAFHRSICLSYLGRESEALQALEGLYSATQFAPTLHLAYGTSLIQCGYVEKARPILERVVKKYETISELGMGKNPHESVLRAVAYSRLRRFQEADKDFENALIWIEMDPELLLHHAGYLAYRSQIPGENRLELEKRALDQLETAQKQLQITTPILYYDPDFAGLREHPRFKHLMANDLRRFAEELN